MAGSFINSKFAAKVAEHYAAASVGVVLIMLAIGYLALFSPAFKAIKAADRAQALGQEKTAKTQYLAQLKILEANYAAIPEDDVKKIASMIPLEEDIPGLLATFQSLGEQYDVTVSSLAFSEGSPPPGMEGLKAINIVLSLDHLDYPRFKQFLTALEQHLRIFDVESVSLNPSGAAYNLTLRTYAYPSPNSPSTFVSSAPTAAPASAPAPEQAAQ